MHWAGIDFPDTGVFEIASFRALNTRKLAIRLGFRRIASHDSIVESEGRWYASCDGLGKPDRSEKASPAGISLAMGR